MNGRDLALAGLFATTRPLASVKESAGIPGTGMPERLLTARQFNSLELEVLPGRGFDIGDAWFRGIPISWFSPVRDARALPALSGTQWVERFTGGLITTCGLHNIGPANDGQGMHGTIGHLPADEVAWRVEDDGVITMSAAVESVALFGPSFRLQRTYRLSGTETGATVHLRDTVINVGVVDAPLSLLYHVNLGAPLVAPRSVIDIDSTQVTPAQDHPLVPDWTTLPDVVDQESESVFEHLVAPQDDGFARATVTSPIVDVTAVLEWSAATLPRLNQWVVPTRGRWALALEPSSAPLFGPDRASAHAGAPVLAAGESRLHELRLTIRLPSQPLD